MIIIHSKIIILSIFLILLTTGCGKEKYIMCDNHVDNYDQNYKLDAKYKIYYKGNNVTKIEIKEDYTSSDENIIKYLKEYKDLFYKNQNDLYGGYTYNLKKLDGHIILDIMINLKEVNLKNMIIDGYLSSDYVINNKLTTTGAKYFYASMGAKCN